MKSYDEKKKNTPPENKDKEQTPAPKVSSGADLSETDLAGTKEYVAEAEKDAAKKETATKTPKKIQEGDLSKPKREY